MHAVCTVHVHVLSMRQTTSLPDGLHDLIHEAKLRSDKEVELVEVLVLLSELGGGQAHHLVHPKLLQEVDIGNQTNLTNQKLIPHYHLQAK